MSIRYKITQSNKKSGHAHTTNNIPVGDCVHMNPVKLFLNFCTAVRAEVLTVQRISAIATE